MALHPVFLSVVLVLRNRSADLRALLADATSRVAALASDYEVIVVDNASADDSIAVLKDLTGEQGLANLQVYALTKEVDTDTACWIGMENALGDFIAALDPLVDDLAFLPAMLDKAVSGTDVVFAANQQRPRQSASYGVAYAAFNGLYKAFSGVHLAREAPTYRVLSKKVANFILQHPHPALKYRHLPATGAFSRAILTYSAAPKVDHTRRLWDGIDRGMRLLVSTTRSPMRLVTALSLFGAVANLVYSGYVVAIAVFKDDVAPGWVSLSLQQSGMFFLISLVLMVLGEYIVHMASLSNEGPAYYIGQEFTSARMTRREKLNIEVVSAAPLAAAGTYPDRAA
jgi:polyisoprenyl-phosphate glycosyltransferase